MRALHRGAFLLIQVSKTPSYHKRRASFLMNNSCDNHLLFWVINVEMDNVWKHFSAGKSNISIPNWISSGHLSNLLDYELNSLGKTQL